MILIEIKLVNIYLSRSKQSMGTTKSNEYDYILLR